MKNSKQKKHMISGKTKEEKRRLAFAKRNAKKERNVAEYGAAGGSALVVAKTADFNRRFIAAFLALVFAISCLVVGVNFATKAEDDPYRMQTKEENGLVVSKGLKNNGNGTYDLKLEAYATGKTTTQTLDTDVPLDIVLVLDQSGSMLTKDIYGGNKAIEKTFSIQDIEENEYYYDDNGTLYRVKVDHTSNDVYLPATDENGDIIDTWTAQSAAEVTDRLGRLAFKNGNLYEPVYYDKMTKYVSRSSNVIDVTTLSSEWFTSNIQNTNTYTYIMNDNGQSYWHQIYCCEDGILFDAYYYTFYYYTNSVTGSSLRDTSTLRGKKAGQTAGDVTLLNNYRQHKCYSLDTHSSESYYTHTAGDGKLYLADGISNINNYLFTSNDNGNSSIRVLACQRPDSNASNDYSGNLFAKGYRLYYEKDGQQIPLTDPVLNSTELEYTGTLYEKTINTRLDTLKNAAKQFVKTVGDRAAETGADHRVAVVGFAGNEIPSTSIYKDENGTEVNIPYSHIRGNSLYVTQNTGLFVNKGFKNYITPNLQEGEAGLGSAIPTNVSNGLYNNITYFYKDGNTYFPLNSENNYNTYGNKNRWYDTYTATDGTLKQSYVSGYWSSNSRYTSIDNSIVTYNNNYGDVPTSSNSVYYPAVTELKAADYQAALVNIKEDDNDANHVNDDIDWAVDNIDAYGGTYMSYGLAMAQDVFKYNNNVQSDGTTRKRIVVVFTDGQPGAGGDTWDTAAANEALATAAKLKGQYEASVYTVGLYPDDPGSEVTSFLTALSSKSFTSTTNVMGSVAESNQSDTYYFDDDNGLSHSVTWLRNRYNNRYTAPIWTNSLVGNRTIPVTSHTGGPQQQSEWVDSNGWLRGAKWNANDTRTGANDNIWQFYSVSDPVEQSGNYSFSASNATELNGIFTTISESIQTPTTTVSLTGDAVLKDIVSDNFILPENPTVTVQTFGGTYGTGGNIDFNTTPSSTNPQEISVSWGSGEEDSKTLSVTGFDYSNKYIASGHTGEKIVVNISGIILKKGVVSKDVDEQGFMKIYSNDPASGIYNNASNNDAFANFPMPYAPVDPYATEKNGMILSKRISLSDTDTSYNLKLDAFSTGQTFTEQIPTDYVLVVDQSGSMKEDDVPVEYSEAGTTKDWIVSDGAEPYYYKEVDSSGTAHYYRVYQKRGDMFEYHAKDTVYTGDCVDNLSWFQSEEVQELGAASQYWYNPSLDDSGSREGNATDNNMYPVRISSQGAALTYWIRFQFTDAKGTTYKLKYPNQPYYKSPTGGLFGPGDRWGLVISYNLANSTCKGLSGNNNERYTYGQFLGINTGMYVRQVLFTRHPGYNQLAYKDDNGVEHLLIDATYCNSAGKPVGGSCDENGKPSENHTSKNEAYWNGTLYKATRTTTRLNALKMAMTEFVETVAAQNVGHRVAVAGFSSRTGYNNTELLTGTNLTIQNNNGIQYDNLTTDDYQNALLDVTQSTNVALSGGKLSGGKLKDAIDALTYNGGTEGQYGLYMAKNILDNRSVTTFTPQGSSTPMDRLKIVVYFTDGTPGNYEYDNQYDYGNKVVDAAARIKTSPSLMDTEIYSIGTFGFSDADPLMYQKYSGTNKEYQYDPDYVETINGTWGDRFMYRIWLRNTKGYGDVATDTVSDYMRTITSEYPGASKFVDASWYGTGTKSDNGVYTDMIDRVRGSASGGRHYFLCTDLTGLSRVFKTVASESASTSEQLGTTTIFRDTIDGKNFDYSNVQVEAVSRVVDVDGKEYGPGTTTPTLTVKKWQWSDGTDDHPISEDGVVEVTGFDYTGKAATAGNRGEKLLVTISGLIPKGDAVGDKVYSNTSQSGIYAPQAGASDKQIAPFAMPFIERHSYSLTVGSQNKDATFAVTTKLVRADGHDVDSSDSDALNKVVLVSPGTNGTRSKYSSPLTFTGMGNEVPAFYYENVPEGYKVQTGISTNDAEYTYYLTYDDEDASKERALSATSETNNFTFDDHQLHIRSEANTKKVTLKETVTGDFAVPDDLFSPIVHLVPPAGVTAPQTKVYGDYEWKKDENENWMTTTLGEIQGDNADSIVFDVPTGWSIVISNAENDRYQTVSFTVNGGEPVAGGSYTYMIPSNLDNSTIVINNSANNIPVTGINENESGNMLWYILAAVVVFATGAAGIYVYRRKRSVVER